MTARTYEEIGAEVGRLVTEKQVAYGDSFGKAGQVMRVLYPSGISAEQMDDALAVVRVLDKLFRIATDRDALGESPWRDIAGYAVLGARRVEEAKPKREECIAPHGEEADACAHADGSGACLSRQPGYEGLPAFCCTRGRGHAGDHIAAGTGRHILARWPGGA